MIESYGGLEAGGILLTDKPKGLTSHDVVAAVRKLVKPLRVGHTGTLDPMATGLLIICIGKATRVAELLQGEHKLYRASVLLGLKTDTQDIEGKEIERRPVGPLSPEQIQHAAQAFVGWIEQQPPAFSAVKVNGVRAYRLARKRQEPVLKPRRIEIKSFEIEKAHLPLIGFTVECSKGTYVRTLCNDFGEMLGVGGCMESLRRLRIGPFSVDNAIELSQLREKQDIERAAVPLSEALGHLPKVVCDEEQIERLSHGMPVRVPVEWVQETSVRDDWVCARGPKGSLVALGKVMEEKGERFFQPKKLLAMFESGQQRSTQVL